MARDYYEILGVTRDSTETEIRAAYRKLAHKYHPDKTGGDAEAEAKLKEINEAYDVLKNKEKRAKYDRFGADGVGAGGFGGGFGGGASPFDEIFETFFGGGPRGGRGRQSAVRGDDLEYAIQISLRDAAFGVEKTIRFKRREICEECGGSGAAKGAGLDTCTQCGGAGQVRMSQGFFSITRTCPVCQGTGRVVSDPCRACVGSGGVQREREVKVSIPAGVDTGTRMRMTGEGEAGRNGGPRGDLYVLIEVEADDVFQREGNDLICEVPISFPQAVLGATITVPTLEGNEELKIPAGTQSGTVFRLRGLGIPDVRGYHRGDQLIETHVETPTKLTKEQKELIRQFDELSSAKSYPLHRRFLDRIKQSLKD